jgi:hypothetical protein
MWYLHIQGSRVSQASRASLHGKLQLDIGLKRSPEGTNGSKENSDEWQPRKEPRWQKWRDGIKVVQATSRRY